MPTAIGDLQSWWMFIVSSSFTTHVSQGMGYFPLQQFVAPLTAQSVTAQHSHMRAKQLSVKPQARIRYLITT